MEEARERLPRQVKNVKVKVTVTGKSLDQQKMLKRKMKNCDNAGWITLNPKAGQYPKQALVTLKTGMFELFQTNFLNLMKSFNIGPTNSLQPVESIKVTKNDNGIERIEYDLTMEIGDIPANLKVKIYLTKSSFDVQGLKPHFETVFEALGNRTIAVYFVEVVLDAIFQSMMNECNLEEYNIYCKTQAKLGLDNGVKPLDKNADQKGKKVKTKIQEPKVKKCNICDSKRAE